MLFTMGTATSTRGRSHQRALQHLTTGVYISELCLIGLFAIGVGSTNQSIGPLVLMVIFLVGTAVWHVWLGRHLRKTKEALPSQIREEAQQGTQPQASFNGNCHEVEKTSRHERPEPRDHEASTTERLPSLNDQNPAASLKRPMAQRAKGFFHPTSEARADVLSIAANLSLPSRPYTQQEHDEAYLHPATTSECPIMWIPKDKYGLSKKEINASIQSVEAHSFCATDEGAWFNDKGQIEWEYADEESISRVPIWENQPHY